ncbi:50S ribosomal protein L18 [Candidatus Saganbacteria bacterium]|nr:50S ribosomal protein L18 [Candidatus Saganbacteria bacterium]
MRQKGKRKKIFGTSERPRLSVRRTLNNIHVQIIDDAAGKTLVAVTSLKIKNGGNIAAAQQVGKMTAKKAVAAGISKVVFDRGLAKYHGRIKALADAAREGGLLF